PALLFVTLNCGLWAQSTAQIQGSVQDASGAAVSGAIVKAIQTETRAIRSASTNTDGTYTLTNLSIGPYRVEVSKPGFSTSARTGIVLHVESRPTVDISLTVGNLSEQLEVTSNAA